MIYSEKFVSSFVFWWWQVQHFRRVARLLSMVCMGFIGGFLSFPVLDFYDGTRHFANDPIAIANTYIVFTTVIFAGLAVVIAIIGYVFTQQFAIAKELHIAHLVNELQESILDKDSTKATDILKIILKNDEAKAYFINTVNSAIAVAISEKYEDLKNDDIINLREMISDELEVPTK
jgi:predicted PurR-regulated permease PerM